MKFNAIPLIIITFSLYSCSAGIQRNYSNESADSLRQSFMEEQQHFAKLHQTGNISQACLDAINDQLNMALKSLEHDTFGETRERDRAMNLSDEAGLERKSLGCPYE